jgi:transcriptional regulator with XRE-family HTH domain
MHISSPLRMLRFQKGLTQDEVATAVGCRQWVISMLERGERLDGPTFPKVARFFDTRPGTLKKLMRVWRLNHPEPQASRLSVRRAAPPDRSRSASSLG